MFYYIVQATNAAGDGANSAVASAQILPPLPDSPDQFTATYASGSSVALSWTAAANAAGYKLSRATASDGPYTVIASGLSGTSYADGGLSRGTPYYYVVAAVNAGGESLDPPGASATPTDQVARLKFDETGSATAADATGHGWIGTLLNGAAYVAGKVGNAVNLDGTNDHVSLPSGVVNGLTEFTAAAWVYLDTSTNWARVFDFGTGATSYMFLTPRNGNDGFLRFSITTGGPATQQRIDTTQVFPTGVWKHVAVTLAGGVGVLYLDGVEVGRNSAMTLTPASLGLTTQNYVGRSQFAGDPYLDGRVDDLRIYNRALSTAEVVDLTFVPSKLGDYNADGVVEGFDFLAWQRQLGNETSVYRLADGDGSGRVDTADLGVWRQNAPAATSVTATSAALAVAAPVDLTGWVLVDEKLTAPKAEVDGTAKARTSSFPVIDLAFSDFGRARKRFPAPFLLGDRYKGREKG
jgi:hypothetical protein